MPIAVPDDESQVIESLLVAGTLMLMIAFAVLPPLVLLQAGGVVLVAGLVVSLVFGLAYHVRLYQGLVRAGGAPARWWVSPVRLHPRLSPADLKWIRPPFLLGASGFVAALGGCAFVALGVLRLMLIP